MTETSSSQPLIGHLLELRTRLMHSILAVLLVFVSLVYFANDIYRLLADPLMKVLPEGASMIATDVAAPFFTPIKLTIVVSCFIAMPYMLSQLWGFIAPGLYQHERKMAVPLVAGSGALFYAGIAFAYSVVLPLAFAFFTKVAPEGVTIATDISNYLDFVLKIFFAFGLAFEIPIATVLLCWSGATTPDALRQKRPYVIVGVFVIGMLLTPPDVISQTLLAFPMWLLFELGLVLTRFYSPREQTESTDV
ncbi:twin-arginine translocase subunit TatC [Alginatibacterium sediminis]|uniref:Sec-independent protein translocase protein TatC n=1 Tax=Alginatibacterium sediminis TaxID=2164068 RepID=A0A420E612_9ALTE|nr:twin-arginine translocase subunit TatC [Alginatibacterium sediminis]RKF13302.1 twin-arginine translocase subunit TatC [Alginatibacterium sediminis]